jgi:uncharacterized pyridoxamine 5'-phosphate oxidase family protein
MEKLDFDIEEEKIFKIIGESRIVALATSSENKTTVRTMSVIVYSRKIYFQTGIDLLKYKQICKNKNVALCFENIQIEGIAKIIGKPVEHKNIMKIKKKYYLTSFETYSKLDKEILIEIIPIKITEWNYDVNGKPYRIFIELESKKSYKEMYLEK